MNNVLFGSAISAGLVPAALGVEFATVAAGNYPIGAPNDVDPTALPPERFHLAEPFQIGTREITNAKYIGGLQQLDRRATFLFRTSAAGGVALVARGPEEAVKAMTLADLRRAVEESVTFAELSVTPGGVKGFDMVDAMDEVFRNGPRTLEWWGHSLGMDTEKNKFAGGAQPVVFVSRDDALLWSASFGFGIPTEKMWEAAARGLEGRKYATHNDGLYTNSSQKRKAAHFGEKKTADVGSYPGVLVGGVAVFDLTGNVWEWTRDDWHRRGGAWNSPEELLLASARRGDRPDEPSNDTGFRVVRDVPVSVAD